MWNGASAAPRGRRSTFDNSIQRLAIGHELQEILLTGDSGRSRVHLRLAGTAHRGSTDPPSSKVAITTESLSPSSAGDLGIEFRAQNG